MDVRPPTSAAEAENLVTDCLGRYDTGGRSQLYDVMSASTSGGADGASPTEAFSLMLHALLISHVLGPRLAPSAFSNMIRGRQGGQGQGQGRSTSRSPETGRGAIASPDPGTASLPLSPLLTDAVLDAVWAVDVELESRRELSGGDLAFGKGKDGKVEMGTARKRLAEVVAEFVRSGVVARETACERLDAALLTTAGLVSDETAFNRKGIRINTATLYKQQKFNLLREENEGYSGLITELITGMGPPIVATRAEGGETSAAGRPRVVEQETPAERTHRARKVMSNISALIGYFDLDPNRVLDIILDIFSSNVTRYYPFFLALLAASPWGRDRSAAPIPKSQSASANGAGLAEESGMDVYMEDAEGRADATGPQIPGVDLSLEGQVGNTVCAQVLGFKFAHYQLQETKEDVPEDLYLMAALLIREGYVRLTDLYTHLTPNEDDMNKLYKKYQKALSDKVAAAKGNALSMAAPLSTDDDDTSASKAAASAAAAAPVVKEPPNQRLGMLRAFLALGNLKHALFILARYPWLCGAYPDVASLYCRILNHVLAPTHDAISFATLTPALSSDSTASACSHFDTKKQLLVPTALPKLVLTAIAPEPARSLTIQHVFFFQGWKRDLPRCGASEDVLRTFAPLLRFLGVHLHRDVQLLQRLCRIGKVHLKTSSDEQVQKGWLDIVRLHLLPALSLTSCNSGLVAELWLLLRTMPYETRFALYGEWKYVLYKQHPELRVRKEETEKEAKGILKRISKENLKPSGRNLAKASHANPTIFFTVALNQVQAYDNLVVPIVESAKYLTHFEYDVFSFIVIDALSNPEKERTKQDGTNISLWLKSLAAFTGTIYKRYQMMDTTPVLQYVANQLKANNSKDLVIIRELILKMTGIEPLANLADNQIAALTGGRYLRTEAMMAANASAASSSGRSAFRKSGARLLAALEESKLAVPLLILVAQQRQVCVHLVPENEAHLKYLGNLYDSCQEVLFQYVEFLNNQLDAAAYSALVPSLHALCIRFGIEPAIAFYIARPKLVHTMKMAEAAEAERRLRAEVQASKVAKAGSESATPTPANEEQTLAPAPAAKEESVIAQMVTEDQTMNDGSAQQVKQESVEPSAETQPAGTNGSVAKDKEVKSEEAQPTPSTDADAHTSVRDQPATKAAEKNAEIAAKAKPVWHAGLNEALEMADELLPEIVKNVLGSKFYVTFWQLSLYDVTVPTERYEQERKRINQLMQESDASAISESAKSAARERYTQALETLSAEMKEQVSAHQATRRRLAIEKEHWFGPIPKRGLVVSQMLQHCIHPRALLSPTDAMFAAKFLRLMHSSGTRNFSSITAYDKIFMDHVAPTAFSCTENEARNYSRFLHAVLSDLSAWHRSLEMFNKEAVGNNLPGFQMRWNGRQGGEEIPKEDMLSWQSYCHVLRKWHDQLRSAFKSCLVSREYMRVRNVIVVMTRIAPFFPVIDAHGKDLVACIEALIAEEKRGDLKVLAQGYMATLQKGKSQWITQAKFTKTQAPTTAAKPPASPPTGPKNASGNPPTGPAANRGKDSPSSRPPSLAPPPRPTPKSRLSQEVLPETLPAEDKSETGSKADSEAKASAAEANGKANGASSHDKQANGIHDTPTKPSGVGTSGRASPALPSSLPTRPSREPSSSSPDRRGGGGQGAHERPPPSGPRADSVRDKDGAASPAATLRDSKGAAASSSASAARQAVLDSMNPPKNPASTPSAQAVRERNTAERERHALPSSSRGGPDTPAERARDLDTTRGEHTSRETEPSRSKQPSPRPASSRDVSPTASRRSRAGSEESSHSHSRRSGRDRESDKDRDRERERDRDGRRSDRSGRDRRDRDREGDRDRDSRRSGRDRDDHREARRDDAPPSGPRSSRDERRGELERRRATEEEEYASKRRKADREEPPTESSRRVSSSRDAATAKAPPTGPAASRSRHEERADSPSGGKKRSLADRLSAAEAGEGSGGTGSPTPEAPGSSKRVKINRSAKYAPGASSSSTARGEGGDSARGTPRVEERELIDESARRRTREDDVGQDRREREKERARAERFRDERPREERPERPRETSSRDDRARDDRSRGGDDLAGREDGGGARDSPTHRSRKGRSGRSHRDKSRRSGRD